MGDKVIGVDVGTGSARAGVFDRGGKLLGSARHPIRIWHDPGERVEQSSADIWRAVSSAVRAALAEAGVDPADVRGIGFDATCSLVVLAPDGSSLPVGPSGDPERDVIVWMDHRAIEETRRVNAGDHAVLAYVGGAISPEMQVPKLMWLKARMPDTFAAAGHFLDLSDFLTFRATGSLDRSACTVTCKWTYLAHEDRWDDGFFRAVGLAELVDGGHARIGERIVAPATALGAGLTGEAAADLGLLPGTPVAASLIDAHAGAVGTMGGGGDPGGRIAHIFGTSACIMAATPEAAFVPGIWGPYFGALYPGAWLIEGGQSAAGAAIDQLVRAHLAHAEASAAAAAEGLDLFEHLERRILARAGSATAAVALAGDLHVLPDLLGNRSPWADPDARGVVAGLGLDTDAASLERLYVAAICGLGYATGEVIDAMRARGVRCDALVVSGGAIRSPLVRRLFADATGVTVDVPQTPEPVLLGSAMLGAVAAGLHPDLRSAMSAMSRTAESIAPSDGPAAAVHAARRRVFALLRDLDRQARAVMREADAARLIPTT